MKKILFLLLVVVLLVPSLTFANEGKGNEVSLSAQEKKNLRHQHQKRNLEFYEKSDTRLVYTYEEGQKKYKVIEDFSDDYKSVSSKIYIYNENKNDYRLKDEFRTVVDEKENTVTQYSDDTEETIQLDDISNNGEISIDNSQNNIELAAAPLWRYWSTTKGTNTFTRWSVGAIAIILSGITKLPVWSKTLISLSAYTYSFGARKVYWTRKTYKDANSPRLRPRFKSVTYLYANSSRTKVIKNAVISYH